MLTLTTLNFFLNKAVSVIYKTEFLSKEQKLVFDLVGFGGNLWKKRGEGRRKKG